MMPNQEEGIFVLHHDGTRFIHTFDMLGNHDTVLADIDSDNRAEILVLSQDHKAYPFNFQNGTFSVVPGWPQSFEEKTNQFQGLVVGNIDSDSLPEIILSSLSFDTTKLFINGWNGDGTLVSGYHHVVLTSLIGYNDLVEFYPLALGDIEKDGKTDIVVLGQKRTSMFDGEINLYILPTNGFLNTPLEWPTYRGNKEQTGCYKC